MPKIRLVVVLIVSNNAEVGKALKPILTALLPSVLLLSVIELVSVSYRATPEAKEGMALLWSRSVAPLYWAALVLGIALPFILFARVGQNQTAVIAANVLAVLGIFATKIAILLAGQALPFMRPEASYMPTGVEIGGVIGIAALAGLLFVLANRYVPVQAQA